MAAHWMRPTLVLIAVSLSAAVENSSVTVPGITEAVTPSKDSFGFSPYIPSMSSPRWPASF